jgi:hypothetical protein
LLRALRDIVKLNRASRRLGRASKLKDGGEDRAAADGYVDVLRLLNAVGTLPSDAARFSIRDIVHVSIRVPACAGLAELLDRAGDRDRSKQLAREVLDLCASAPRTEWTLKWAQWARDFVGPEAQSS